MIGALFGRDHIAGASSPLSDPEILSELSAIRLFQTLAIVLWSCSCGQSLSPQKEHRPGNKRPRQAQPGQGPLYRF